MEAAGAPRLDVERPFKRLVRRSTRGAGQRGPTRRDKSGTTVLPSYAVALAEGRSARLS